MPILSGTIRDVVAPSGGTITVQARSPRQATVGTAVVGTHVHTIAVPATGIIPPTDIDPGPIALRVEFGSWRKTFMPVMPAHDVDLWELIEAALPYEPAQIAAFTQLKTAAVTAAGTATTAATEAAVSASNAAASASAAAASAAAAGGGGGGGDIRHVSVVTGDEARPTAPVVIWIGGDTEPANMGDGDIWLKLGAAAPPPDTTPPSTPTGLASSAITASSFTLTWSAATDDVAVTGYQVRRDAGTPVDTTALTYNVTGLAASTGYSVDVRARDAAGNFSAWSTPLSVTTDAAGAPPAGYSIFGTNPPPGTYTGYTDGGGSIKLAEAFYYTTGVPLKLVGARLWLPTGLDSSFYTDVTLFAEGRNYPTGGTAPSPDWPTMTHTKTLTTLSPGWNEITFDTPIVFTTLGTGDTLDYVWVGYTYANGNNYIHSPNNTGGLTDSAIESTTHTGLFLAEKAFERSINSLGSGNGASYGIDALFEAA